MKIMVREVILVEAMRLVAKNITEEVKSSEWVFALVTTRKENNSEDRALNIIFHISLLFYMGFHGQRAMMPIILKNQKGAAVLFWWYSYFDAI